MCFFIPHAIFSFSVIRHRGWVFRAQRAACPNKRQEYDLQKWKSLFYSDNLQYSMSLSDRAQAKSHVLSMQMLTFCYLLHLSTKAIEEWHFSLRLNGGQSQKVMLSSSGKETQVTLICKGYALEQISWFKVGLCTMMIIVIWKDWAVKNMNR